MKLSKQNNNIPILLLLLLVVSVLFISMKPNETQSNDILDIKELELVNENQSFFDVDIDCTEEIVATVCGNWQLYSSQDCNCTKPAWNSWFNKNKYRRWCRTGNVGWGGWEYSPWVCNEWCRYK